MERQATDKRLDGTAMIHEPGPWTASFPYVCRTMPTGIEVLYLEYILK